MQKFVNKMRKKHLKIFIYNNNDNEWYFVISITYRCLMIAKAKGKSCCAQTLIYSVQNIYTYIVYIYSIWYIEVCWRLAIWVLTYCFLKHVMGQILIALTLWVIFRMPSSQIYKYREIMPDIWHMIKWSHDQQQKKRNLVSLSCPWLSQSIVHLSRRRVRANNMMICYIDIIRIRADRQRTFVQLGNILAILFGYFI